MKKAKKKKIILLGMNPFNSNRGVGALSYSTIYLLDQLSAKYNIDLDISVGHHKLKQERLSISVNNKEIKLLFFPLLVGRGIKGLLKLLYSLVISRGVIFSSSYVLDIGEGDSFSDIYGIDRFESINTPKKIFRFLGYKQLMLPQTIGPFKNKRVVGKAKRSIEKSSMIMARDRMSYNYVIEKTSQKRVSELIDVAFFMPFNRKIFNNNKINVGINVSSLMWHGGYTKNNQFGFKFSYQEITDKMISYFLSFPEIQIHLVPHVVSDTKNIENDYEVSAFLERKYNTDRITLAPLFLDPIEAKSYISGLDFFLGARMHACIAAYSSGVPVYPVAYSRKFNGLFIDTLGYEHVGDLINQTSELFFNGLQKTFNNRELIKKQINMSLSDIVKPKYDIIIEQLANFLEIEND